MFDVLAELEKDSPEYRELQDRIVCGQLLQQEEIDRIKGIEATKMPKEWYDYKSVKIKDTDTDEEVKRKEFNIKMLANKKPYFFIYNYPMLRSEYNKFIKDIEMTCVFRFGISFEELINKKDKTYEEEFFVKNANNKMPVFRTPSTMNRICYSLENIFKEIVVKLSKSEFDYSILTTSLEYDKKTNNAILKVVKDYYKKMKQLNNSKYERLDTTVLTEKRKCLVNTIKEECLKICNNEEMLTNILINNLYTTNNTKQLIWDICGEQIIKNLLDKNNNKYTIPIKDDNGNIEWCGEKFKMQQIEL